MHNAHASWWPTPIGQCYRKVPPPISHKVSADERGMGLCFWVFSTLLAVSLFLSIQYCTLLAVICSRTLMLLCGYFFYLLCTDSFKIPLIRFTFFFRFYFFVIFNIFCLVRKSCWKILISGMFYSDFFSYSDFSSLNYTHIFPVHWIRDQNYKLLSLNQRKYATDRSQSENFCGRLTIQLKDFRSSCLLFLKPIWYDAVS